MHEITFQQPLKVACVLLLSGKAYSTLARACMLRNKLARGNNCAETMPRIKLPGPGCYIIPTAACMQVESLHVKLGRSVEIRKMNARTLLVC